MPKDTRARTRAIRAHQAATGLSYTAAAAALDAPWKPGYISITECMQENGYDYAGAVAFLEDPANELLCEICGWTVGMICPSARPAAAASPTAPAGATANGEPRTTTSPRRAWSAAASWAAHTAATVSMRLGDRMVPDPLAVTALGLAVFGLPPGGKRAARAGTAGARPIRPRSRRAGGPATTWCRLPGLGHRGRRPGPARRRPGRA